MWGVCTTVSGTALAAFGASNMTEEELMDLRMNHCVSHTKMQVLSKSGARGVNPQLKCTKRQCNICIHANITCNLAPPASASQTATVRDMSFDQSVSFDQFDMSKITTIGRNRYRCLLTMVDMPQQLCMPQKMRFLRSSIVCSLRNQNVTSPILSSPTTRMNITRSSCVKCSKSTTWRNTSISNFRISALKNWWTRSAAKFVGCSCNHRRLKSSGA